MLSQPVIYSSHGIDDSVIDVGRILELIFFQGSVTIKLYGKDSIDLFRSFNYIVLRSLVEEGYLEPNFYYDMPGVASQGRDFNQGLEFIYSKRFNKVIDSVDLEVDFLKRAALKMWPTESSFYEFIDRSKILSHFEGIEHVTGEKVASRLDDQKFANLSINSFLRKKGFELGDGKFGCVARVAGRKIFLDFDFETRIMEELGINAFVSSYLAFLQSALILEYSSINEEKSFYLDDAMSDYISGSVGLSLRKFDGYRDIGDFFRVATPSLPTFRDAVNSGQMSQISALNLIRDKDFRDWLHKIPDDRKLAGEFLEEIKAKDPSIGERAAKFLFFDVPAEILGNLVPGAGIAISAFDRFLLSKAKRGWTPSQFVDLELAPRLRGAPGLAGRAPRRRL